MRFHRYATVLEYGETALGSNDKLNRSVGSTHFLHSQMTSTLFSPHGAIQSSVLADHSLSM